jgi:hypothetical protein
MLKPRDLPKRHIVAFDLGAGLNRVWGEDGRGARIGRSISIKDSSNNGEGFSKKFGSRGVSPSINKQFRIQRGFEDTDID